MSTWSKDNPATLLEDALRIAFNFLSRSGEIDDPMEATGFLADKIYFMISQGQRNRIALANRAIAAFQREQDAGANAQAIPFDRAG